MYSIYTDKRRHLFSYKGWVMFEEAHPSEVVAAYLPLHHDIWSSIKRCCDADFDKTRDVFLQGTSLIKPNRNEDTTLTNASGVAAT